MSAIEWTDATWNPVAGCEPVSAGCANCYAKTMTRRLEAMGQEKYAGLVGSNHFNGVLRPWPPALDQPLRWRKPRMVFVNSMSDLFHEDVPFSFIAAVLGIACYAKRHTFQILTKRPERAAEFFEWIQREESIAYELEDGSNRVDLSPAQRCLLAASALAVGDPTGPLFGLNLVARTVPAENARIRSRWPLPNVWIGTSVEDQERADERIPHLLRCPAAVRFLSCEPLLVGVDIRNTIQVYRCDNCVAEQGAREVAYALSMAPPTCSGCGSALRKRGPGIGWVIVGGESGPGSRPFDIAWGRDLVRQCREAGVPCFVKQLGAKPQVDEPLIPSYGWPKHGSARYARVDEPTVVLRDKKGGDPEEWPEDLKVRQFPEVSP